MNYVSEDLEEIFNSIVSLVFLFLQSKKRHTEALEQTSWEMDLDFSSFTGIDLLLLSLRYLQSREPQRSTYLLLFFFHLI